MTYNHIIKLPLLDKITSLGIDDDHVLNLCTKNNKDGTKQHSSKTVKTSATFHFDENNELINIEIPIPKEFLNKIGQ